MTPVQSQLLIIHTMICFVSSSVKRTMFFFSICLPAHLKRVCNHYQRLWLVAALCATCLWTWDTCTESQLCCYHHMIKVRLQLGPGSFIFTKFLIPNYGFPINPIGLTTLPGHKQQDWLQIVTPGVVPPQDTEGDKGIFEWSNCLATKFWKDLPWAREENTSAS